MSQLYHQHEVTCSQFLACSSSDRLSDSLIISQLSEMVWSSLALVDGHDNLDAEDEQRDQGVLLFALVNDDDRSEDDESNNDDGKVEHSAPLVALESC